MGSFYSSPDLPSVLYPSSIPYVLTCLQIMPQNFIGISKSLLASTINTQLPVQFETFWIVPINAIMFWGLLSWLGGFHWLGGRGHWLRYAFQSWSRYWKMLISLCSFIHISDPQTVYRQENLLCRENCQNFLQKMYRKTD